MTDIFDLTPTKNYDWSIFDKIICNDKTQSQRFKHKNKKILINLRYTNEWVNYILKYLNNHIPKNKNKIVFLLIHSKKIGNIHFEEVIRSIKIISNFKNFELIIKPHPRISLNNNEIKKMKKINKKIKVSFDHMIELVQKSDVIINFQSTASIDALLFNKPVIFLNYATSNSFEQSIGFKKRYSNYLAKISRAF